MDNVGVVETTQDVNNGIAFAYIGKKLVAETFALAGTFYQSCNIYYVANCGDNASRMNYFCQLGKTFVWYAYLTYLWFYCAEGKIGRLCLGTAQAVEQR